MSPPDGTAGRDAERIAGALAALVAVTALGIAWAPLVTDAAPLHVGMICALALLPVLASWAPAWRRTAVVGAGAIALILGVALALRTGPLALVATGDGWAALGGLLPDGLAAASASNLPISRAEVPALAALLDVALLGLAGAAAWQLTARRTPVWAIVALGVGLAYRWTVLPPERPLLAGALGLAAVLAVLALVGAPGTRGRPARRVASGAVVGGAVVLAALAVGAGPGQTEGAWLDWTSWEVAGASAGSASALDLEQRYGQLDWSDEPRVVMRVVSDRRRHLRAAALEGFDGVAFSLDYPGRYEELSARDGVVAVPDADRRFARAVRTGVALEATRTNLLLSAGRPSRFVGDVGDRVDLLGESVRVQPALGRGDRYAVDAWVPNARPDELLGAPPPAAGLPPHLTEVRAGPGGHTVDVPLWGGGQPSPEPEDFGVYEGVARLADRVAGSAATQYAAVNRVEAHLRREYVYDGRPPLPEAGAMPIADFLGVSGRGFCQQFAGSMTLMLRTLGIPSRVVVGYTGGRFDPDSGTWVVIDRDAHSWVEVYFSGVGWVPFDPTPGRSVTGPASVSSPDYAPQRDLAATAGVEQEAVDPPSRREAEAEPEAPVAPAGGGPAGGSGSDAGAPMADRLPSLGVAGLLALMAVAIGPLWRAGRHVARRHTGDVRRRVLAAQREFEEGLARLGLPTPTARTGSERAALVGERTGVDVRRLYELAEAARYAPEAPAPGVAREAWREARRGLRSVGRGRPVRVRLAAALRPPGLRRPGRRTEPSGDTLTA